MKRTLTALLIVANVAVAVGLLATAWVGTLDPANWPRLVILSMLFPVMPPLALVLLVVDFFAARRWCLCMAASMALALPMVFTVFPLNIPRAEVPEPLQKGSWTLMSYNVTQFTEIGRHRRGNDNAMISYILDNSPDVAVIVESNIGVSKYISDLATRLHTTMIDTLLNAYPYRFVNNDVSLLTRFPARAIDIDSLPYAKKTYLYRRAAAWEVDIHGTPVLVVGVHLRSIGLTMADKDLYTDLTKGKGVTSKGDIREVKLELIDKLGKANRIRAAEVDHIVRAIDSLAYENVVVCGDFNDTPGCYALRRLRDIGFDEVYPLVGCGYMHTFNANRLLFQIDHVLVRGKYRPWSMRRGNLKASDHYPLSVTFVDK